MMQHGPKLSADKAAKLKPPSKMKPPKTKAPAAPAPRGDSPAPTDRSKTSESGAETGYESNAELKKKFRTPAVCKDHLEGKCTRDLIPGKRGCKRGTHISAEAHDKKKEENKHKLKAAKTRRNTALAAQEKP